MHHCEELLLACGVANLGRLEFSTLIGNWSAVLHENRPDAINGGITNNLEGFRKVWQGQDRSVGVFQKLKCELAVSIPRIGHVLSGEVREGRGYRR